MVHLVCVKDQHLQETSADIIIIIAVVHLECACVFVGIRNRIYCQP